MTEEIKSSWSPPLETSAVEVIDLLSEDEEGVVKADAKADVLTRDALEEEEGDWEDTSSQWSLYENFLSDEGDGGDSLHRGDDHVSCFTPSILTHTQKLMLAHSRRHKRFEND